MPPDDDQCYRAIASRDPRFDGWFYVGVTSTGIYCRPSCPAITPKRANVRFFPSAAAAQVAGFRACKRCRPDATPGSPEWDRRADVVGRAMRLIADGVVDREGVTGLARRLGYTERHLHRCLSAEVGAGALALARAQRARTSRVLIETTSISFTDVAYAAGFSSIRQFNDTVREVFASTPSELRTGARRRAGAAARSNGAAPATSGLVLRLPARAPIAVTQLLGFLGRRAVPGIEGFDGTRYTRSLTLPNGQGVVSLSALDATAVRCELHLQSLSDLAAAVSRCRRLLDLDADPIAIDGLLSEDAALAPLVAAVPGRRVPGVVDGGELAVRAVLGQQVSVAGARTLAARLVAAYGEPLRVAGDVVRFAFPTPAAIAAGDPAQLGVPRARALALQGLCAALASGDLVLDAGADRDEMAQHLTRLRGIGAWTAGYLALRGFGDPDAFLATDSGVRRGLQRLGLPFDPRAAQERAQRWRPWRAYGLMHLWGTLER